MAAEVYRQTPSDLEPVAHDWLEIPLIVDANHAGYRVDRFLQERIRRLSRMRICEIIDGGNVLRGDRVLRGSSRVRVGDVLLLRRPAPAEPPVASAYRELYMDEDILVIDKPAGLPVHPSARYHRNTLTAMLRARLGAGHGWDMAHRLDRETSGLMVFGRRGASAKALKRAFAERRIEKTYLALLRGELVGERVVDAPLGPALDSEVRVKRGLLAVERGGLPASTSLSPVAWGSFRGAATTLVEVRPRTGRQHQIRVHAAAIGHPVLGDKLYGVDERLFIELSDGRRSFSECDEQFGLARHALHAYTLAFSHPRTGEAMHHVARWPDDLHAVMALPASASR